MIEDRSFSKEWIDGLRNKEGYGKAHPEIMEKMIYALYLVEKLVGNGLDFTFKGGTSLTLLFPEIKRFSIDVDIVTNTEQNPLEEILTKIVKNSRFTKFEIDEKRSFVNEFPKAHYDLFFTSEYDKSEKNILLDIVFDDAPYPETVELPVENNLLSMDDSKINARMPSINSITGDKLTAFAPNTLGIPYNIDKALQIIKQLYDIGQLFSKIDNLQIVAESFKKIADAQLNYQKKELSYDDVLQDTIDTAFLIGMQNKNKDESKVKFDELFTGIKSFPVFLPNPKYSMYNAVEDASRTALLAAKIKASNFDTIPSIDKSDYHPKDFEIFGDNYSPVYKMIKGMPNLSVFYWHHTTKILSEIKR